MWKNSILVEYKKSTKYLIQLKQKLNNVNAKPSAGLDQIALQLVQYNYLVI